jgi:hypothetical protein
MNSRLPNFLIVGTAKAGTTSMYHYLRQHPEIFMSQVKEPHYLVSECFRQPHAGPGATKYDSYVIKDFDQYSMLFDDARQEKWAGEASVAYLYLHRTAIPRIMQLPQEPYILILLRNPIDRAYSAYMHQVRDGFETLSFEEALKHEQVRIKENWLPFWYHTQFGMYYQQVKAYLDNFQHVKICLYDDFCDDSLGVTKDIFRFLNVDESFTPSFQTRFNATGKAKLGFVHALLTKPNPIKFAAKNTVKLIIGEDKKVRLGQTIKSYFLKKPEIKEETRKYLLGVFRDDILALQELIGRDLCSWLR